jgi:O-antigen ligase
LEESPRWIVERERLDLWCERGILGLVLGILVFSPLATGSVRPQDFIVVQWLTVATLIIWALRFIINPQHRLLWPPMCWPVLLFMGYAVARYATADLEYVARQELIRVLVYGFLFFAILNNLHRQETTAIIGTTLVILAMGIAFYAVVQFVTDSDKVWHFIRPASYAHRGSGTFICPNNMGAYLELVLPLGLAYTLTGRFSHLQKVFLGYASLVIFSGIVVSISRGAWGATAVSLLALCAYLFRRRGYKLQVIGLLVVFIATGFFFIKRAELSPNRREQLAMLDFSRDARGLIWQAAFEMWQDHPITGVGPAHFDPRFRAYRPESSYVQARPDRVHNDYLNTLVDWGVIGAALVAAAWALLFCGLLVSWKFVQRAENDLAEKRSNRSAFVLGGTLGLVAILAHSLIDFNMHIPANAILVVTLLALVAGHFRFATERHWQTVRLPLRVVILTVLLAGIAYLGYETWHRSRELKWLVRAEQLTPVSSKQTEAYENALAIEGRNYETAYNIGENYRLQAWRGEEGYDLLARKAMDWFERSMELNPYDPYGPLRYGMCLDWLRRHDEALPYYERAVALDPNSYYTRAHMGWHYVQVGDWSKVKEWMYQSARMFSDERNVLAYFYLRMARARLEEAAVSK